MTDWPSSLDEMQFFAGFWWMKIPNFNGWIASGNTNLTM